jgi:predicted nucleic acid-binding protein
VICVDTTFLIDLWRQSSDPGSTAAGVLAAHAAETFVVGAHAAGEFLEGGASVSAARLRESQAFLASFSVMDVDLDTALHYARIVAHLRSVSKLAGRSKPDLWIAASAVRHASPLVTRNARHFDAVPGLPLIGY